MKRTLVITFTTLLFCVTAGVAQGQWCAPNNLKTAEDLERDYRVIDARPTEVNKVRGKNAFKKRAQIAIINMNPFMFTYDVKVEQSPIEDLAQLDFLKLLGGPISDLAGIAPFRAVATSQDAEELQAGGDLDRLEALTGGPPAAAPNHLPAPPPNATCSVANTVIARQALDYLSDVRDQMLRLKITIENQMGNLKAAYAPARTAYLTNEEIIYSPSSDSKRICTASNVLMTAFLDPLDPARIRTTYPSRMQLNGLKRMIADLDSLIKELKNSAEAFSADAALADCKARLNGFDYASSLQRLANAMSDYRAALEKRSQAMTDETKAYDFLNKTIRTFAAPNAAGALVAGTGPGMNLLQKTFEIIGEFDASNLDIQLIPIDRQPAKPFNEPGEIDAFRIARTGPNTLSGFRHFSGDIKGVEVTTVGDIGNGGDAQTFRTQRAVETTAAARVRSGRITSFADTQDGEKDDDGEKSKGTKANATIGARRFELSGGMVFSTLNRREFQSVLGFARDANGQIVDADGKPTDKRELSTIVGLSESSKSRFAPIVLLNTRLTNNPKYNLFFSVGVTAKRDSAGTDVEYLIGPSFNFLNKNAFFTFGAYAGRQQKLAGDLFVGARLTDSTVPIQKEYKWAPAFSFTYRIPVGGGSSK